MGQEAPRRCAPSWRRARQRPYWNELSRADRAAIDRGGSCFGSRSASGASALDQDLPQVSVGYRLNEACPLKRSTSPDRPFARREQRHRNGSFAREGKGLLRAQLANAGVPFETTGMMLRRVDRDVSDKGLVMIDVPPSGARPTSRRWSAGSRLARSGLMRDEVMPLQYRALYFIHSRSQDTPSPLPPCFRASWKPSIIDAGNGIEPNPTRNSGLFGQWTWSSIRPQCEGRRQHAEEFMGQVCRRFHFRR